MTDLPRRSARAMAAVGLLFCHLTATAQDSPVTPAGAEQVLACIVADSLPAPPAEAKEGGFGFVFESLGGTAVDGRACTVYRLRNLPGSPPTPVRWVAGSEVLVDGARLARCTGEEDCVWFEVARYFDGGYLGGDTVLGYGLNADSFRVASRGLVALSFPDVGAAAAGVGTELVGTVVDSSDREVALDLVVRSRLEREGDELLLVYEATSNDPSQLDGSRFVLAWEAFDLLPAGAVGGAGAVGPFRTLAGRAVVPASPAGPGAVVVRLPAAAAVYQDGLALTVREPGEGGEDLLTVTLPAFLPASP